MNLNEIDQIKFEYEKRRDVLAALSACGLVASIAIGAFLYVTAVYFRWI